MRVARFSATDLRKALKAADVAGKSVVAIDFPPQGGFRLLFGASATADIDTELAEARARRATRRASGGISRAERVKRAQQAAISAWDRGKGSEDPDNPEWTEADFQRARPFSGVPLDVAAWDKDHEDPVARELAELERRYARRRKPK